MKKIIAIIMSIICIVMSVSLTACAPKYPDILSNDIEIYCTEQITCRIMSDEITERNGKDMRVATAKVYITLTETEPDKTVIDYITANISVDSWDIVGSSTVDFVSGNNGERYATIDLRHETRLLTYDADLSSGDVTIERYSASGKYYYQ